jgi:ribosome-dependent ATPase
MNNDKLSFVVSFDNLAYSYGKVRALKNLSLSLPSRKLVGLVGPDGVGKSTLLSLISGARKLQEGSLYVLNGNMQSKEHRKIVCPKIAYMPQGLGKNLYFTLTVEENLQYFALLFGHDAQERRQRIDYLTKSCGLYPFLDRPAGKLSGGMKQKLALCSALIHNPDLLILDEPTTGVDPLARRQFWDLIGEIRQSQKNMSVIVATAYMDEAQKFDWLIAMDSGVILDTGTPKELLAKTNQDNLDAAFIQLLPQSKRHNHKELIVPPLESSNQEDNFAIVANNLTKKFGSFTAVDKVSFKINEGEIFGFLGSNGCGKTTTMRMLTGLVPATSGDAELFGKAIDSNSQEMRKSLGYMTQIFSLYNELTVLQNLTLYAHLYQIPKEKIPSQVAEMVKRFQLEEVVDQLPKDLPLGLKQRLSLAAAVIHQPKILILDEPTSGVDPVARDIFWEFIIQLARVDKVTVFVTTHFMNEAQRCDRISLMHCGKSLVCDSPRNIILSRNTATLEEAFIDILEEAQRVDNQDKISNDSNDIKVKEGAFLERNNTPKTAKAKSNWQEKINNIFSFQRMYSCCWRENLELIRDPIRATLAIFGALILMVVIGYGVNMDVDSIPCAVLDLDKSQTSQSYILNIEGSRYFKMHKELTNHQDLEKQMKSGKLGVAIEIPPSFGRDVAKGLNPSVAFWVDGSMPSRAETINGYVNALHQQWLKNITKEEIAPKKSQLVDVETRYFYNPDVKSLPAMIPAVIPLLLMMIPAILAALSVVREKEMGSIINLYVTPLSRAEFLLGKQIPYILFSTLSFTLLIVMAVTLFDVPIKGSVLVLFLSLFLYCIISTGMGLLASSVTKSQIAVIFLTMTGTMLPAVSLCGMINPVETQSGMAYFIGKIYPTTYMLLISRGVFNKALTFSDLFHPILCLVVTIPIVIGTGILLQKKQES